MKAFNVELDPDNTCDIFGREVVEVVGGELALKESPKTPPTWEDTVFYDDSFTAEDVKKSLVDHDGYNPDIIVTEETT